MYSLVCPVIISIAVHILINCDVDLYYEDTKALLSTALDHLFVRCTHGSLFVCFKHLHAKGRTDDLFSDPTYQQFGEELNKVLKDWQPSVLPDGSLWGRVEEQSLWSSQHLGEQSPASLLRSLVYLNTKYFGLRTVEQHLRLSFANVYGPDTIHPVSKESTVCIRVPSISQDHHGKAGNVEACQVL
ncbi:hypothetical protein XENOCAPTIV_027184 [Xenoophorus captivus]|uniref:DUF3504 domain-containing protein n=1 Tax=Xenoophorus captivus TaxID=1517983 RepID=A0ABV0RM27_9TELE